MAGWLRRRDKSAEEAIVRGEGETPTARRIAPVVPADLSGQAVYVVQAIGAGLVKIGWVRNVARFDTRLARIETDCPFPVELLHLQPGAALRDERRVHRLFDATRYHGEWFRIEGDLKRFLQLCAVDKARATEALRAALVENVLTLKS